MAPSTRNAVLRSLPDDVGSRVFSACEPVELSGRAILARAGETTATVFFPETAVISTLATFSDGTAIEMANVGREACTGTNVVLGLATQISTDEVQVGGAALAMSVDALATLRSSQPAFERALFATQQALFHQVMVSGACNAVHGAKQRLARWLLTMDDRSDDAVLPLTHEFLAEVLGLRRATVSDAAAGLREEGLIAYARGRMRITDRPNLEAASCECYHLVREANRFLLPTEHGAK